MPTTSTSRGSPWMPAYPAKCGCSTHSAAPLCRVCGPWPSISPSTTAGAGAASVPIELVFTVVQEVVATRGLALGRDFDGCDAVQGEAAQFAAAVVHAFQDAAADADGGDEALAGDAVGVDEADPDVVPVSDGLLEQAEGGAGVAHAGAGRQ